MIDTGAIAAFEPLKERLCLDFINTADEHLSEPVNELLTSYPRLIEWSVFSNAITDEQGETLLSLARQVAQRIASTPRWLRKVLSPAHIIEPARIKHSTARESRGQRL